MFGQFNARGLFDAETAPAFFLQSERGYIVFFQAERGFRVIRLSQSF